MGPKLHPSMFIDASFEKDRHLMFLIMMNDLLPSEYESQEINTLTLAYFVLSSLDIIGAVDQINRGKVASWILSFQVTPTDASQLNNGQFFGFHGSRSSQFTANVNHVPVCNSSHLASTYCALATLKILGYDFSQVDSKLIAVSMNNLQRPDGSFMPIHIGAEADLRFVYCAAAISYMLDDWSGVNKEKAKEYIINCQSYDGGFGLTPGLESHGGATYCALASLLLMGFIEQDLLTKDASSSIINIPLLVDWLTKRQGEDGGFQGRINKPTDTCYAFWVGGSMKILGCYNLIDKKALRASLLTCQSKYGGFSKFPGQLPELYHSHYGFSAFSLLEESESGLDSLLVELGITHRAAAVGL